MGITDLFDADKADLSRITRGGRLYATDAVHNAVIEVNEQGSEAAAATGQSRDRSCIIHGGISIGSGTSIAQETQFQSDFGLSWNTNRPTNGQQKNTVCVLFLCL